MRIGPICRSRTGGHRASPTLAASLLAIALMPRPGLPDEPVECTEDREVMTRRVRDAYATSGPKLRQPLENITCRLRRTGDTWEADVEYHILGTSAQEIIVSERRKDPARLAARRVHTYTPDFHYGLRQDVYGGPFVLESLESHHPGIAERTASLRFLHVMMFAGAAHSIWNRPLGELLQDPTFRILDCENVETNGRAGLKLHFDVRPWSTYQVSLEQPDVEMLRSGSMILIPELDWAVAHYDLATEVTSPRLGTVTGQRYIAEVESERWLDGAYVFPRRVEVHVTHERSGQQSVRHEGAEFNDAVLGNVADSQFLLSTFDLPDSLLQPASNAIPPLGRTPGWWVSVVLGLLLGALLYRLRRADGTAQKPPSGA